MLSEALIPAHLCASEGIFFRNFASCIFQVSFFSKDNLILNIISTLASHLCGPLATSQKSRVLIQSLNNCSLLKRDTTEVIHEFLIFCAEIFSYT